jgi:hypothetical protein
VYNCLWLHEFMWNHYHRKQLCIGEGWLISQEKFLGYYFPLKLYRLSLVYKLLGVLQTSTPPPPTLIQTCGINFMFIPCICPSTVYSPITLCQHTRSDKSFVFTLQSDSSLLLPTFSPNDVLFTSCSLSHYIIKTKYLNN